MNSLFVFSFDRLFLYFFKFFFLNTLSNCFVEFKGVGEPAICAQVYKKKKEEEEEMSKPSVLMETAKKKA